MPRQGAYAEFLTLNEEREQQIKEAGMLITDKGYQAIGPLHLLAFNMEAEPLNDIRVRRALAHAVDRDWVVNVFFNGRAREATAPSALTAPSTVRMWRAIHMTQRGPIASWMMPDILVVRTADTSPLPWTIPPVQL